MAENKVTVARTMMLCGVGQECCARAGHSTGWNQMSGLRCSNSRWTYCCSPGDQHLCASPVGCRSCSYWPMNPSRSCCYWCRWCWWRWWCWWCWRWHGEDGLRNAVGAMFAGVERRGFRERTSVQSEDAIQTDGLLNQQSCGSGCDTRTCPWLE